MFDEFKREDLATPERLDKLILSRPISNEITPVDAEVRIEKLTYSYRESHDIWCPDSHFSSTDGSTYGFSFYSYSNWKGMPWSEAHLADDSETGREIAIRDIERRIGNVTDRNSGALQIRETKTVRTVRGDYFESVEEVSEVFYVSKRTIEEYKAFITYYNEFLDRREAWEKEDAERRAEELRIAQETPVVSSSSTAEATDGNEKRGFKALFRWGK